MSVPSLRGNGTVTAKQARQTATHRPTGTPASNAENGTNRFRPRRLTNEERRPREHLSRDEVLALCKAARRNRNGTRDAAAIWIAFNHGLRISELWFGIAGLRQNSLKGCVLKPGLNPLNASSGPSTARGAGDGQAPSGKGG